mmetsp:Transcript_17365/g.40498  ORF Transcript_17365/g.40498 Transcript_17365/m.40498 type:complete len:452 (-) Transcript_17365:21-1376(-)|eukprot:CAMPEP_0178420714 /NCGR_PEP_ID=MMETSP0689_2-20121128/26274_1 /TAXON_ID=160604 /ORGANISM="Amphidinium massartii, Strain CS-259" /LENGTH=451 /DNA_ID=CAMNT_0020042203 /DNA_START=90 /DNA_END=1445 /DNA_ORIENTATION=+
MASLLLGTPQATGSSLDAAFAAYKRTTAMSKLTQKRREDETTPAPSTAASSNDGSDVEAKPEATSGHDSCEEELRSSTPSSEQGSPKMKQVASPCAVRPPPGFEDVIPMPTTTAAAEDDADDEGSQASDAKVAEVDLAALPSIGSAGHFAGTCDRCCFFPKGRCLNGYNCDHCHFEHEKRKRKSKKQRKAEEEAAKLSSEDSSFTILDLLSANPALVKSARTLKDEASRTSTKSSCTESTANSTAPASGTLSSSASDTASMEQQDESCCPPPGLEFSMPMTASLPSTLSNCSWQAAFEEALREGAKEAQESSFQLITGDSMPSYACPLDYEVSSNYHGYQLQLKDRRISQLEAENEQLRKALSEHMGQEAATALIKETKSTVQRTSLRGALSAKATPFVPFQVKAASSSSAESTDVALASSSEVAAAATSTVHQLSEATWSQSGFYCDFIQ